MKYLLMYIYTASKSSSTAPISGYTAFMAALTYARVCLRPYVRLLLFVGIGIQIARHGCKVAGIAINFDIE